MNKPYRIICGDAEQALYNLEDQSVDCCFTSPDPAQSKLEIRKLLSIFEGVKRVLKDEGSLWVEIGDWHDYRTGSFMLLPEMFVNAMHTFNWIVRDKLVWHMPHIASQEENNRFKRDYHLVYRFLKRNDYYFNETYNLQGTSVFTIPYVKPDPDSFDSGFPEELIRIAILPTSPKGGTILDPFCGSAVTGEVALMHGRKFIGIEIVQEKIPKIKKRLDNVVSYL